MMVDCQWIHKNLEALFCGTLSLEEDRIARAHIESCGSCNQEVGALNAIDPLVKRYFQGELNRAVRFSAIRSRTVWKRRLALTSAGVLAASVLPPSPVPESAPPVKTTDTSNIERAKPLENAPGDHAQSSDARPLTDNNASEFLVTDPAGYSRTLGDYRGHTLVIGVLNSSQPDSTSNLERLYEAFGSNSRFRFLAISDDHQVKPANTTFPIAYNQGSKLFEAAPGDFVLLDEAGKIRLRGSLVKDFESLRRALQGN